MKAILRYMLLITMHRVGTWLITVFLISFGIASTSQAEKGDLLATYDFRVAKFALDPVQSYLYATLPDLNSVAIINTNTLTLVDTVFIGSNPRGVAVSTDGSTLFVATSGSTFIAVMDIKTRELLPSILLPTLPSDIEVGRDGRLYVTPASQSTGIMQVDSNTGDYLGDFSFGVSIYMGGALEISPDHNTLYFGNSGLSPGTLAKYDVSTEEPSLLYKNPHGDLGSNGQDLALSHDGEFISYAVGSGNGLGYTIYKIRSSDFAVLGEFATGAYPREITFSSDDAVAYAVHTTGEIDLFDTQTFLSLGTVLTSGQATELIVDQSGSRLFSAFIDQLRVYETGYGITPNATLTISPPSGDYVTTQGYDLVLIVEALGLSVAGGSATLNGSDVTPGLAACIIPGTLVSGGQTFRCPGLTGSFLGTGTHTLNVTLDLSNGSSVNDTVTWEVKENTEP